MALVALVLVAVGFVVTSLTRQRLIEQVDRQLTTTRGDGDDFRGGPPGSSGDEDDGPPNYPQRRSALYQGVVRDGTLTTIFASNLRGDDASPPALDTEQLATSARKPFTTDSVDGTFDYRVVLQELPDGDIVVSALPLTDVDDTVNRLAVIEIAATLTALAALGMVSWWVIHLGIRPVKAMTVAAAQIGAGHLDVRVPEASPSTESGQLATALNQMLGQLEDAFDDQRRSEDRLRRFVADASHELRTPVTTIRGYAELYRMGGLAERTGLDDAMRRTEQEAQRMGRLVDDMLTLAKLDEGRPLQRLPVDLSVLLRDAANDTIVAAPDHPIEVEVVGPLVIIGDDDRLRQVIANLVGNAVAHTPAGTPIRLRGRRDADTVELVVADRGPGMDPELAARVTERFFRADPSRARTRGGSGLGLAIADAIVAAHGGTLDLTSAPGEGTTVTVRLPVGASTTTPT